MNHHHHHNGGRQRRRCSSGSRTTMSNYNNNNNSSMITLIIVLLVNLSFLVTVANDTNTPVQCVIDYNPKSKMVTIPINQMNDGYCDCIYSGLDELDTGACSGYTSWPGTTQILNIPKEQEQASQTNIYQCPQQKKLQLSTSKLQDGICDCCDGTDELLLGGKKKNECFDQCDIVLQQERELRINLMNQYTIGSQIRTASIQQYQHHVETVQNEIQQQNEQYDLFQQHIHTIKTRMEQTKMNWYEQHVQHIQTIYSSSSSSSTNSDGTSVVQLVQSMLQTLSISELQLFLVYTCQLAGEMMNGSENTKTCVPLRLAGLDHGIQWESKTYTMKQLLDNNNSNSNITNEDITTTQNQEQILELVSLLLYNQDKMYDTSDSGTTSLPNTVDTIWMPSQLSTTTKTTTKGTSKNNHKEDRYGRRRLSEYDDDDYEYEEEEEEEEHDYQDNDEDMDEQDTYQPPNPEEMNQNQNQEETYYNKDELVEKIKNLPFFTQRVVGMIEQSIQILDTITEIKKTNAQATPTDVDVGDTDTNENDDEDNIVSDESSSSTIDDTSESSEGTTTMVVDPMSYNMVQNQLEERVQYMERGMNYGVSALVLIDAVDQYYNVSSTMDNNNNNNVIENTDDANQQNRRRTLEKLIIGTLYYSNLSTFHLYQILQYVIPELFSQKPVSTTIPTNTCSQPLSSSLWIDSICPPEQIIRSTTSSSTDVTKIPSDAVKSMIEVLCQQEQQARSTETIPAGSVDGICSNDADENNNSGTPFVPTEIPDGYYGYHMVRSRSVDDPLLSPLGTALHWWSSTTTNQELQKQYVTQLQQDEIELQKYITEQKNMDQQRKELLKSIGGTIGSTKFGPNGELYSIRDECFEVTAGKYIYEICLYKSAKQRDVGTAKGSGTDLGKWDTWSHDDEKDHETKMVWKFKDGAQCWNGPKRSATIYLTCGQNHLLLSADEPDTCRYVFQMESPLGCTEQYKMIHEL